MTLAMVFPGQGSQSPGMQGALAEGFPVVRATFDEAGEVLGEDLWALARDGPAETLAETTNTQPVMLAAGVAAWRAWHDAGGAAPAQLAGHSLGEYTALVCAGAVDFTAAVAVVRRRARLMQEAVPAGRGAMAAILGLDDDAVGAVCRDAAAAGVAEPVNYNSPGQVVIAGESAAVDLAIERARAAGARRAILLPVSVPSHSSLMRAAAEELAAALADTPFRAPQVAVMCAVTATPYGDTDEIRRLLAEQIYRPVRWTATVAAMAAGGASTFVECGPGKVLAGLVRRIDKSLAVHALEDPESLAQAMAATNE